jgi:hypothetical protein
MRKFDDQECKMLKMKIGILFSSYSPLKTTDALATISEYYSYLESKMDHHKLRIDADPELLEPFEAVFLLLKEKISIYPEAIWTQIGTIAEESKVLRILSLLATLQDDKSLRGPKFFRILKLMPFFDSRDDVDHDLKPKTVFDARLGLRRMSQILKYAVTLQVEEYEPVFEGIKDHYDPNRINKNKILSLIGILTNEIEQIEDVNIKRLMLGRLETIEKEVRKQSPKWGNVITWFFVLFSFVADLKGMAPGLYEKTYDLLGRIVATLHIDGTASGEENGPILRRVAKNLAIREDSETKIEGDE